MQEFGRTLIIAGLLLVVIGVLLYWSKALPWLGKLPGDIVIHKDKFTLYFPLATSLLLSAILTLLFYFFKQK